MTFFPLPGTYAVVEIDIDKTLDSLNDPAAKSAAAGMKTTKCIVYLDTVLNLPFPANATFKYMAHLIGPGLRPEKPELFLIPDMCIPIYPNTAYPSGDRPPLMPRSPFPFSNCYQWLGPDMEMDLRVWNEGRDYPEEERLSLPADQQVKMESLREHDMWRSASAQKAKEENLNADKTLSTVDRETSHDGVSCLDDRESVYGSQCGSTSSGQSRRSTELVPDVDIFGLDFNEWDDMIPIVRMWPDVGGHFKKEDVPSPMEFVKQYEDIVRIVKESKASAKALRAAQNTVKAPPEEYLDRYNPSELSSGRRGMFLRFWKKLANASASTFCLR